MSTHTWQGVALTGLAATAVCLSAPAWAASQAQAQLGAITVLLTDLDENDGITPWIDFIATPGSTSRLWLDAWSSTPGGSFEGSSPTHTGTTAWGAVNGQWASGQSQAQGEITGPGTGPAGLALSAQGQALDPWAEGVLDYAARYGAAALAPYQSGGGQFLLSPQTRVQFVATGQLMLDLSHGHAADTQLSSAYAQVFMSVSGPSPGHAQWQVDARGCVASVAIETGQALSSWLSCDGWAGELPTPGLQFSWEDLPVSVSFENASAQTLGGTLQTLAHVSGLVRANVVAVPEPASLALWLLGLAGLAGLKHRRGQGR